jgi:hypothetical protein
VRIGRARKIGTPRPLQALALELLEPLCGLVGSHRDDTVTEPIQRCLASDASRCHFYAHEDVNQVFCHNVSEFGGLWLVVTPNGAPAA